LNPPELRADCAGAVLRPLPRLVKVNRLAATPTDRKLEAVRARANFRSRHDELEARHAALLERLKSSSETSRRHPSYRCALTLLNDTFRKEKLAQRLAVLQAAAWLIDVLEKLSTLT
jgi:hypothetical protein